MNASVFMLPVSDILSHWLEKSPTQDCNVRVINLSSDDSRGIHSPVFSILSYWMMHIAFKLKILLQVT